MDRWSKNQFLKYYILAGGTYAPEETPVERRARFALETELEELLTSPQERRKQIQDDNQVYETFAQKAQKRARREASISARYLREAQQKTPIIEDSDGGHSDEIPF